jgi:Leu/Phe-tRNA-protein transferase
MKNNDFCVALSFRPQFLSQLFYQGFLPIAEKTQDSRYYLLPKLHSRRCILHFDSLHVSKKVRQRAKKYEISIDTCFSDVVQRCIDQHGENWLFPPMRKSLQALHDNGQQMRAAQHQDHRNAEQQNEEDAATEKAEGKVKGESESKGNGKGNGNGKGKAASKGQGQGQGQGDVQLHSIEVWRVSDGKLVAGEIGTQVGAWYTSLTAFTETEGAKAKTAASASSAGTIQCCCIALLLQKCGFSCWDLGMEMDYK